MSETGRKKILVITGPTASGKSAFIYEKLTGLPLEVINADSGQVYKELDVGVAAPSKTEQKIFRHHLLQHISITERYSAGRFCREAREVIQQIHSRGNIPLVAGGTFFYLKSLWDGISIFPEISSGVSEYVDRLDNDAVRNELKNVDRASYERISPNDMQRNRRALLVSLSSGKPFSEHTATGGIWSEYEFLAICFYPAREKMYEDINRRTKLIFENGLVAETVDLLKRGFSADSPGFKTIGYREVVAEIQKLAAIEEIKHLNTAKLTDDVARATRQFAKRQMTWFNADLRLKRIDPLRESSLISGEIGQFCLRRQSL